jgi:hypothetical protein
MQQSPESRPTAADAVRPATTVTDPDAFRVFTALQGADTLRVAIRQRRKGMEYQGREQVEVTRDVNLELTDVTLRHLTDAQALATHEPCQKWRPYLLVNAYGQQDTLVALFDHRPRLEGFSTLPSFLLSAGQKWAAFWQLRTPIRQDQPGSLATWTAFQAGLLYQGRTLTVRRPERLLIPGLNDTQLILGIGRYDLWTLAFQAGLLGKASPTHQGAPAPARRVPPLPCRLEIRAQIEHLTTAQVRRLKTDEEQDESVPVDVLTTSIGAHLAAAGIPTATALPVVFECLYRHFTGIDFAAVEQGLREGSGEVPAVTDAEPPHAAPHAA